VDVATNRSRVHVRLSEHLVDACIGGAVGVVLGLAAVAVTVWLRFR
jgi:hypothetical protein